MPMELNCSQGHRWQMAEDDPTAVGGRPISCPVCSAPHVTVSWTKPGEMTTDDLEAATGAGEKEPAAWPHYPEVPGYEIVGILGRGGMGVVYKAWQTSLKRPVALKMVLGGAHADEEQLARFKAEAEAAASLQHPHIVQIYEIAEHQGLPYFSLEFVGGGSLAGRLGGAAVPADHAGRLVEMLARAVQAAHEKGIVHRDLKPANILLSSGDGTSLVEAVPKITDFGLAKRLDLESGRTQSGAIMGTPSYMAPEQASGQARDAGPLADVYALGAILYECLTGLPPFRAATPLETARQVVEDEPVPPRRLQPRTPRDLETICLKCLRKEPHRRYLSATALADDLRRFLAGEPIEARPVAFPERAWKWSRRNPSAAALIAVCLLTVLGAAAGITAYTIDLQNRAEEDHQKKIIAEKLREKAEKGESDAKAAQAKAQEESQRANAAAIKEQQAAEKERQANFNANRNLYDLRVYRTARAVEDGEHSKIIYTLAQMHPEYPNGHELRGFEWYYWDRLVNAHIKEMRLKTNFGVRSTTFSPHGRLLVYGDGAHLTFLSAQTGKVVGTAPSRYGLTTVVFSPDGRYLAAAGAVNWIQLYDFGRPEKEWPAGDSFVPRLKPPDRLKSSNQFVQAVAFSPKGDVLAWAGSDGNLVLWDPLKRRIVTTLRGSRAGFRAVAFRPDGLRLAAAHNDGSIHLWELPSYKRLESLRMPGLPLPISRLAYRPGGNWLVGCDRPGNLHVWAADSGKYVQKIAAHKDAIHALHFSPDGRQLVTGGEDHIVKVWDGMDFIEQARFIGHSSPVVSVAFRPDGRQIVSSEGIGNLKFWDAANNPTVAKLPRSEGAIAGLAFSRDAQLLAAVTRTGDLEIWKVRQRRLRVQLKGLAKELVAVAWHPRETTLAVAGSDGSILLRDGGDGKSIRTLMGHTKTVRALAFNREGTLLASGGDDCVIRVWHIPSGKIRHVLPGHPYKPPNVGTVRGLAFHPDGKRLVSVGYDARIRFWDVANGVEMVSHLVNGGGLECVGLDPTGNALAYGGSGDCVVRWCPIEDGSLRLRFRLLTAHQKPMVAVAFTPDGRRLISASRDGTIRFWNTATFQEMLKLGGLWAGISALSLSPNGHFLAAASGSELLIWDASPRDRVVGGSTKR